MTEQALSLPAQSLYALTGQYAEAACVLADIDADPDLVEAALHGLKDALETKAVNVAYFIRNQEVLAQAIKDAEANMAARRKALENRIAEVKAYLLSNMIAAEIHKIECPYFKISVRHNPMKVVITDPKAVPFEYMRQPPILDMEPDKKKILDDLKEGVVIEGAQIERSQRLEIK